MPRDGSIRTPIDFTLKSGWSFDSKHRIFASESGETFSPFSGLPKGSRVVHKVPQLARADVAKLSGPERALQRYMQLILPAGEPAAKHLRAVQAWPAVEAAHVSPQVSLPRAF
jgi:hypothetical protein